MRNFKFDIVVGGIKINSDDELFDISDALYESGCDDALTAAYNGTLYLSFDREGKDYESAVLSAIADIEKIPGLQCRAVDMGDTVSLSDAAELAGSTKAALSRYSKGTRGKGDFPTPISRVDSSRPLWAWEDIAEWLEKKELVNKDVVLMAKITAKINTSLNIRHANAQADVNKYINLLNNNKLALSAS